MLNQYFKRIYVINLKSREDRRDEMFAELSRLGLSFEDKAVTLFSAVKPEDPGAFPSIGARGCFMSHLRVLTDALEKGGGPIAILEDDLAFSADFWERAPETFNSLSQKDWSVFYGGYEAAEFTQEGLNTVPHDMRLRTTHFICFSADAVVRAKAYLEAMLERPAGDAKGGPMHVDGAYNWLRNDNPDLLTYAVSLPLGHQRNSKSDIADLRWFDRAPVISDIASLLRRLRR